MHIVEQTSAKLNLYESATGVWIVGGLFLLVGTLITTLIPGCSIDSLNCKRFSPKDGICKIVRPAVIGGGTHVSFQLNELQESQVKTYVNIDKKGREHKDYRIILLTENQNFFFTSSYSQSILEPLSTKINNFVSNSEENDLDIKLEHEYSLLKWIFSGIAASIGLFFYLMMKLHSA